MIQFTLFTVKAFCKLRELYTIFKGEGAVIFVNFYSRYVSLCNQIGKSPSKVALEIGAAKATVNRWKNGSMPTDATAQKLADYFGVTVAHLKGEEEMPQNAEKPTNPKIGELSEDEIDLIADLRRLAEADHDTIRRMIKSFSSSGEK